MIDTRLHTLLTLMEAGSYTKAARVLSLTQPAVSHHIRQLEQEYREVQILREKLTQQEKIVERLEKGQTVIEDRLRQMTGGGKISRDVIRQLRREVAMEKNALASNRGGANRKEQIWHRLWQRSEMSPGS